jgi:hypothetical protein
LRFRSSSVIDYGMRWLHSFLACAGLAVLTLPAMGQKARLLQQEIGPSGQAYLDELQYRRIQTDVEYFDPAGSMPPLDAARVPVSPPETGSGAAPSALSASQRALIIAVAMLALGGIMILFVQGARGFALSMQQDSQNPTRARRQRKASVIVAETPPADFDAILAIADRRKALVMLADSALARTVAANGVFLQPSWTLREAIGHLPGNQPHGKALRDLVMAGERVLFGNRDVTEADFQTHAAEIRPLMVEPRS